MMTNVDNLIRRFYSGENPAYYKSEIVNIFENRSLPGYPVLHRKLLEQILEALNTTSCLRFWRVLKLLQELQTIDPINIRQVRREFGRKDLKAFIHSGDNAYSCPNCSDIRKWSENMDNLYSIGLEQSVPRHSFHQIPPELKERHHSCIVCNSAEQETIKLPCGHGICFYCKQKVKKQSGKSKKVGNDFICPIHETKVSESWLESSFNFKAQWESDKSPSSTAKSKYKTATQMDTTDRYKNFNVENLLKVECPKCKRMVMQDASEGFFTECTICEVIFCSSCKRDFHGTSDCFPNKVVEHEENRGATANKYEIDYYEHASANLYSSEEIQSAFVTPEISDDNIQQEGELPWEIEFESGEKTNGVFPAPYESLQVGKWVEDVLLEKALQIIIEQNDMLKDVAFLESFIMNWSVRKDVDGNNSELEKVLIEKSIWTKKMIFSLINTDTAGHGGHWILGVINLPRKSITLLDSSLIISSETFYQKFFFGLLRVLHIAYSTSTSEYNDVDGKEIDFLQWKLCLSLDSIQQENAYDCGPLAICNAFTIATLGHQLTRLPKSLRVRSWLFYTLITNNEEEHRKIRKTRTIENQDKLKLSKTIAAPTNMKPFSPRGLKIIYDFCKNRMLK